MLPDTELSDTLSLLRQKHNNWREVAEHLGLPGSWQGPLADIARNRYYNVGQRRADAIRSSLGLPPMAREITLYLNPGETVRVSRNREAWRRSRRPATVNRALNNMVESLATLLASRIARMETEAFLRPPASDQPTITTKDTDYD